MATKEAFWSPGANPIIKLYLKLEDGWCLYEDKIKAVGPKLYNEI